MHTNVCLPLVVGLLSDIKIVTVNFVQHADYTLCVGVDALACM